MEWVYEQEAHSIWRPDGSLLTNTAYSGHGKGLNNPLMQGVKGVGPIPQGDYILGGWHHDPKLGRLTGRFVPDQATRAFILSLGREPDTFDCHGDNPEMNFTASDGCLIAGHIYRLEISQSPIKAWKVKP